MTKKRRTKKTQPKSRVQELAGRGRTPKHVNVNKQGNAYIIGSCKHCGVQFKDKRKRICNDCKEKKAAEKNSPIAYTIKDDLFGEFHVKRTANAWWLDRIKLEKLIDAFKIGSPINEARMMAGISRSHLEYFRKKHPEFSEIIKDLKQVPNHLARQKIVSSIVKDVSVAQWWATKKMPKEFGDKLKVDETTRVINYTEDAKKRLEKYRKNKPKK